MKRNRLISLPGGLTILGGTTPILKQGHNEHVDLILEDFDFASYDVQTGVLTITNSQPQVRVFHEQYHFTKEKPVVSTLMLEAIWSILLLSKRSSAMWSRIFQSMKPKSASC